MHNLDIATSFIAKLSSKQYQLENNFTLFFFVIYLYLFWLNAKFNMLS